MDKLLLIIGAVFSFVAGLVALSLLLSLPLYFAWNYVMPAVFHQPELAWLQAWALSIVAGALFKSSSFSTK